MSKFFWWQYLQKNANLLEKVKQCTLRDPINPIFEAFEEDIALLWETDLRFLLGILNKRLNHLLNDVHKYLIYGITLTKYQFSIKTLAFVNVFSNFYSLLEWMLGKNARVQLLLIRCLDHIIWFRYLIMQISFRISTLISYVVISNYLSFERQRMKKVISFVTVWRASIACFRTLRRALKSVSAASILTKRLLKKIRKFSTIESGNYKIR